MMKKKKKKHSVTETEEFKELGACCVTLYLFSELRYTTIS